MKTVLPLAACAAMLAASGAAHAVLTGRWRPPASFAEPQQRLDAVPTVLGPWSSRPVEQDAADLARVGIRVILSRQYRNLSSGRTVDLLVVGGRPGPISVHTPDVCFQGAGFQLQGEPTPTAFGPAGDRLWSAPFAKPTAAAPVRLSVNWGWDGGDGWEAPDHRVARVRYVRRPALYKVYLVTDSKAAGAADEPLADLAARLLPALHAAIYPPE